MTGHELRTAFLDFFKSKGHAIIPSDSLVPNDPTLLFTTAGMVQFKPHFEGSIPLTFKRAATSQKCLRASGKQNDLEEVGKTNRHFTFFEMLGNFSFGDYFKREAIEWAWEFIHKVGIPEEPLWVSIYLDDDEAFEIWNKDIGVRAERIVRLGMKDNFWPPVVIPGPCGPCSEIFIDLGPEKGCGKSSCQPGCNCDRFFEFWNLVFQTYTRDEQGELHPLPTKNIDTGMCLERLGMIVQKTPTVFDMDLVRPIVEKMSELTDVEYGKVLENDQALRVLADHVRCLTFAISDGVMPSNEGRGYVLRRILRRGVRYGSKIGMKKPFIYRGVDKVVEIMGNVYPELIEKKDLVTKVILAEEERFQRTIEQGLDRLYSVMSALEAQGSKVIPGKEAFELYDTYGFPLDLTQNVAEEKGFIVDESEFQKAMEEQRERGRAAWQVTGGIFQVGIYNEIIKEYGPTKFEGYENISLGAKVIAIVKDDELLSGAKEGDEVEIVLDKTPFYGEVGGQIGDTGIIYNDDVKIQVLDSIRPIPDIIAHKCKIITGNISPEDSVIASVDAERRQKIAVNHTATHILHSALREVLGSHVAQAGSLVAEDRLRFDFTHYQAVSKDDLKKIESLVNQHIRENTPVSITETTIQEAKERGATALFGEKYGEIVRVVQLDGYSMELCGGTHIKATGEIGEFKILSESSIAAGVRRIEAITGELAYLYERQMEEQIMRIADMLRIKPTEVADRVELLIQQNKELEKKILRLQQKSAQSQVNELLKNIVTIDGVKILAVSVENLDRNALRSMVDELKAKMGSGVVILGSSIEGKVSFIAGVTDDLIKEKSLKADVLVRRIAEIAGGSGGGRADMAQAGGKDPSKIAEALAAAPNIIAEML
ncbi:MAG: alanine--tRNA ligase [bacterium]